MSDPNEPRRYLTGDADQARVELVIRGPEGNGDYYVSIVPEGHKLARLADVTQTGEDLKVALGPYATVRVVTSGEPSQHQGVAEAVAQLYRAMGGEVRRQMLLADPAPTRRDSEDGTSAELEALRARAEKAEAAFAPLAAHFEREGLALDGETTLETALRILALRGDEIASLKAQLADASAASKTAVEEIARVGREIKADGFLVWGSALEAVAAQLHPRSP
jgi:hypothetical protein